MAAPCCGAAASHSAYIPGHEKLEAEILTLTSKLRNLTETARRLNQMLTDEHSKLLDEYQQRYGRPFLRPKTPALPEAEAMSLPGLSPEKDKASSPAVPQHAAAQAPHGLDEYLRRGPPPPGAPAQPHPHGFK